MHGQTYRRWAYITINEIKCLMNTGLLKHRFQVTTCGRLNAQSARPVQHRAMHVWSVIAWLAGILQVWYESSQLHSVFSVASLGRYWLLLHKLSTSDIPRDKTLKEFKSAQRSGLAIGFLCAIHCSGKTLFTNIGTARRADGGTPSCMNHNWIIVCISTTCNSPSQVCWKKVGSQMSVFFIAWMENHGGRFEHFL